eukprot:5045350-Prorocentrum_lima.AAC.1
MCIRDRAIAVRNTYGLQVLPLPHCGGRAVAGLAEVKGVKLVVASLYLNTGGTVKLEDRRLLSL